jgi:hypothetical protein
VNDDRWLTDHLLGEDDPELREEAARRIAADPELAQRAAELRGVMSRLSELPSEGWPTTADHADIPPVPADAPAPDLRPESPRPPRRRRQRAIAIGLAAVIVFLVGVGVGVVIRSTGRSHGGATQRRVALRPIGSDHTAKGEARLTRNGHLRLTVSGLPQTGHGKYYEAWLMTSAKVLVPLATFRTSGGSASLNVIPPTSVTRYRYIDISLQSHANGLEHSSDSVLRGSTRGAG